jgi:membrane protein
VRQASRAARLVGEQVFDLGVDAAQHWGDGCHQSGHAVRGAGYVFFILGGIAAAMALQNLYEVAFDVEPSGMKDTPRRLIWLGVLICAALLVGWGGPHLRSSGGPAALGVVRLIALTLLRWLTIWILLGGRVPWRELFPGWSTCSPRR